MGVLSAPPGAGAEVSAGALGNTAKSEAAPNKNNELEKAVSCVFERRFELQEHARGLLKGERHRIHHCQRTPNYDAEAFCGESAVSIHRHVETGRVFYRGVQTCGSVWSCPVCAQKISVRRAEEAQTAFAAATERGMRIKMITTTVPHQMSDPCKDVKKLYLAAVRKMKGYRAFKQLTERAGRKHSIRALEVRFGENGWHVHGHEIWFCDDGEDIDQTELLALWQRACRAVGLGEPNEHGVRISGAAQASEYLVKQGQEWELVNGIDKRSKVSRSPFELLADSADGDAAAGIRFVEYVKAFHGSRQLVWSRGCKVEFGVSDPSDDELAADVDVDELETELVYRFGRVEWGIVKARKAQGAMLAMAASGGRDAVDRACERLFSSRGPPG